MCLLVINKQSFICLSMINDVKLPTKKLNSPNNLSPIATITEKNMEDDEQYILADTPGKIRTLKMFRYALILVLLILIGYAVFTKKSIGPEDELERVVLKSVQNKINETVVKKQVKLKKNKYF